MHSYIVPVRRKSDTGRHFPVQKQKQNKTKKSHNLSHMSTKEQNVIL